MKTLATLLALASLAACGPNIPFENKGYCLWKTPADQVLTVFLQDEVCDCKPVEYRLNRAWSKLLPVAQYHELKGAMEGVVIWKASTIAVEGGSPNASGRYYREERYILLNDTMMAATHEMYHAVEDYLGYTLDRMKSHDSWKIVPGLQAVEDEFISYANNNGPACLDERN